MSKESIEGVKEILRTIILSVVSYLLTDGVLNTIMILVIGERLTSAEIIVVTGLFISVLSGIDKYLHKMEIGIGGNGLTVI